MRKDLAISQKTLLTFIKQRQLSGVVAFLNFIKKQAGLKDFYDFCSKNKCSLPNHTLSKVLFHGSPKKQTILDPNTSIGQDGVAEKEAFVYATDDPNYAIFLALLNLNKLGGASVYASSKNTKLSINLGFVNGSSKLNDGYVHIVSSKFFKKMTNKEHKTHKSVNILFSIPVTPQDLTVPIYIQTKP